MKYLSLKVSFFLLFSLSSCSVHKVDSDPKPFVISPEKFKGAQEGKQQTSSWWEEFDDPDLSVLMNTTLQNNWSIQQAWSRLDQAKSLAGVAWADNMAAINLNSNVSTTKSRGALNSKTSNYSFGATLGYEVDIWGRIKHQSKAAKWNVNVSEYDLIATALTLTGSVAELWFQLQEQNALKQLLEEQTTLNQALLDLLEIRFASGESTALDIYQQKQELLSVESELPQVHSNLETLQNQLLLLLGMTPGQDLLQKVTPLASLPPFPNLGTPQGLLENRPDLLRAHAQVVAADHDLGEAIANRYPKISFALSYDFSASKMSDIFNQHVWSVGNNLLAPVVDGGRRSHEANRRQAVLRERLEAFTQAYLVALTEVENSIVQEKRQVEKIDKLKKQKRVAESNLRESRTRYLNGLSDYRTVISSLKALNGLERRLLAEERQLLVNRSKLCLALGGSTQKKVNDTDVVSSDGE